MSDEPTEECRWCGAWLRYPDEYVPHVEAHYLAEAKAVALDGDGMTHEQALAAVVGLVANLRDERAARAAAERERDEARENLRFHECCTPGTLTDLFGHETKIHGQSCPLVLARMNAVEVRSALAEAREVVRGLMDAALETRERSARTDELGCYCLVVEDEPIHERRCAILRAALAAARAFLGRAQP